MIGYGNPYQHKPRPEDTIGTQEWEDGWIKALRDKRAKQRERKRLEQERHRVIAQQAGLFYGIGSGHVR